jgi:hypothetical protein
LTMADTRSSGISFTPPSASFCNDSTERRIERASERALNCASSRFHSMRARWLGSMHVEGSRKGA